MRLLQTAQLSGHMVSVIFSRQWVEGLHKVIFLAGETHIVYLTPHLLLPCTAPINDSSYCHPRATERGSALRPSMRFIKAKITTASVFCQAITRTTSARLTAARVTYRTC